MPHLVPQILVGHSMTESAKSINIQRARTAQRLKAKKVPVFSCFKNNTDSGVHFATENHQAIYVGNLPSEAAFSQIRSSSITANSAAYANCSVPVGEHEQLLGRSLLPEFCPSHLPCCADLGFSLSAPFELTRSASGNVQRAPL